MTGGRGSLLGALLGAAVIFLIENLLGAVGLSSFWSQAVYGATLIAAVVFAALSAARARRRSLRAAETAWSGPQKIQLQQAGRPHQPMRGGAAD